MDILQRIRELRDERGWSNYRLTEEAQLPCATLSNMFARQTLPSITTLTAICNAFGISLAQFFSDDTSEILLSDEEKRVLQQLRLLKSNEKKIINLIINEFINQQQDK